jgi:hypothetical protein
MGGIRRSNYDTNAQPHHPINRNTQLFTCTNTRSDVSVLPNNHSTVFCRCNLTVCNSHAGTHISCDICSHSTDHDWAHRNQHTVG